MQIRQIGATLALAASLGACADPRSDAQPFSFFSPRHSETEAYVRAIEAGMAHAERVQEMRRSAARREWRP